MGWSRVGLCAGVCALAVLPVMAQVGALELRVIDGASGEPLSGATVVLSNTLGLVAPTAEETDAAGRVVFPVLRAGSGYVLDVSHEGHGRNVLSDLRVRSERTESHVVVLGPRLEESVRVRATSTPIELERSESVTRFGDEFIERLPVPGRFYQNILSLAPGVKDADGDGNPNVHGARARDFQAQVSGVSNVDPLTGKWLSYVHPDSIEEIEIIPSGATAEFSRAQGGFARILQKQGSNEFEGLVSFLYRSSKLDGQPAEDFVATESNDYRWLQPSLQLSGPVVRDRLWYRLSHQLIDREDPLQLLSRFALQRQVQYQHADQLTWQASPRNKLALQLQVDPLRIENFGVSTRVPVESTRTLERGGSTWSLTWTAAQSPRLLVESIIAYQDHEEDLVPSTSGVRQDCALFGTEFDSLNRARCENLDTTFFSGSHHETTLDHRQRLTVRNQATWFVPRFLGVSHRLKGGVSVENERFFRDLDRGVSITFTSERDPFGPDLGPARGLATVTVPVPSDSGARAGGVSWGVFVEDQIKPAPGLAITLGLRYDRDEINSAGHERFDPLAEVARFDELNFLPQLVAFDLQQAFTAYPDLDRFQIDLARELGVGVERVPLGPAATASSLWINNRGIENLQLINGYLSPRLALAWDPWADGKTKLAVSAGRYYDKIFLAIPLLELEPPTTNLTFDTLLRLGPDGQPRHEATVIDTGFNPTLSVSVVDRGLRTPYQDELSASVERALWPETTIRLTWLSRRFRDQLQDVDINHGVGDYGRCRVQNTPEGDTVVPSLNDGQPITDPFTHEEYIDTAEGPGDGRLDDCQGSLFTTGPVLAPFDLDRPDGKPDLYVLNPGWGEILLVGNFNETDYQGWIVELTRRLLHGWQMNASYTWSEAEGQAEDFDQVLGNEATLRDDERGFLSYDQRHAFRLNAAGDAGHGIRIGVALSFESGLPYSRLSFLRTLFAIPPVYSDIGDQGLRERLRYPTGQRNDQRNPSFWNLDARVSRDWFLGRAVHLEASAEVFNLLADDTLIVSDEINAQIVGLRRPGRSYQLGVRLAF